MSLVATGVVATGAPGSQPIVSAADEPVADVAAAGVVQHDALVPEVAAIGYPKILKTPARPVRQGGNREVFGTDLVGRHIVSGGDFLHIELDDGTIVDQQYFAAWNIDNKQPVCFDQLDFDNEVMAIEPGPTPTQVYVGGRFLNVAGADGVTRFRSRIALVDLADCSLDRTFVVTGATAKIDEIVYTGDRLFVGGDFKAIGGVDQPALAELDPVTGEVVTDFSLGFVNQLTSPVSGLAVNPDATRLIVGGRFGDVTDTFGNTLTGSATAIIDITAPAPQLTAHQWVPANQPIRKLQDISIAPDASTIGVAFGVGTSIDYALLVPADEAAVQPRWELYMRDSSFGIGVTNTAVYVGGHFCYIDAGPGGAEEMSPKLGFDTCTGTRLGPGVWRTQIAALSLEDGTPLAWNPGSNAFRGISEITPIDRGLLIGHDGDFAGDRRTGALVFLDFGADDSDTTAPSDVEFLSPTDGATISNPTVITGQASDDVAIADYRIAIEASDGQWVQADGSLGADRYIHRPPLDADDRFTLQLPMPAGTYTADARAFDTAGNFSDTLSFLTFVQDGIDADPPTVTFELPDQVTIPGGTTTIVGTASDTVGVTGLDVVVATSDGRWVQEDGTFADTPVSLPYTVTDGALGGLTLDWTLDVAPLPAGIYTVTATATDASGNSTSTLPDGFEVDDVAIDPQVVVTDYVVTATLPQDLTAGYSFTMAKTGAVDAVAIGDTNGDGILNNPVDTPIAIWRWGTTEPIIQTVVPLATPAENGFFWVDLPETVILEAGVEYAIAYVMWSSGELNSRSGTTTISPAAADAGFNAVRAVWANGNDILRYPGANVGAATNNLRWGIPNFTFAAVPDANEAPTISPIAEQNGVLGEPIVPVQVNAFDPEAGVITYSATDLPDGISIDANGLITGTPTVAGTFASTITVTDDGLRTATTTIEWTIASEPPPPPCRVTSLTGGTATIEWDPVENQRNNYNVLVDGRWRASISQDAALTWTGSADTDSTIVLRARPNWTVTDITCTNTFEPPPPPPEPVDPTCTVTDRVGDTVTVVWTPVPGEPTDANGAYQVRVDARWKQSVSGADTLTWTGDAPEGSLIEIRSRQGATLTDVTCT